LQQCRDPTGTGDVRRHVHRGRRAVVGAEHAPQPPARRGAGGTHPEPVRAVAVVLELQLVDRACPVGRHLLLHLPGCVLVVDPVTDVVRSPSVVDQSVGAVDRATGDVGDHHVHLARCGFGQGGEGHIQRGSPVLVGGRRDLQVQLRAPPGGNRRRDPAGADDIRRDVRAREDIAHRPPGPRGGATDPERIGRVARVA